MLRIPTQEEKELKEIIEKADKEGWIEHGEYNRVKKGAPEWVHKAWYRRGEIRRSFILPDPPTEQDHQEFYDQYLKPDDKGD